MAGVGDIILQAAQGIVAMHQSQQRLALRQQQLDQVDQAQKDAAKAREDGLRLREQNLQLSQQQFALTEKRFQEQTNQFEKSQAQQQRQFNDRLEVSQFNAVTNFKNMLVNARNEKGQLDMVKLDAEFKKLQLDIGAKKDIALDKKIDRYWEMENRVKDLKWSAAKTQFLKQNEDPILRGRFGTLNSPGEMRREFDKAIKELREAQALSQAAGRTDLPQLIASQKKVEDFTKITDFMNASRVFEVPSEEEVFVQAESLGFSREDLRPTVEPRITANEATGDHVGPDDSVKLIDIGVRTGNWSPLVTNSVVKFDSEGRIDLASASKLFQAVADQVAEGDEREKAFRQLTDFLKTRASRQE